MSYVRRRLEEEPRTKQIREPFPLEVPTALLLLRGTSHARAFPSGIDGSFALVR